MLLFAVTAGLTLCCCLQLQPVNSVLQTACITLCCCLVTACNCMLPFSITTCNNVLLFAVTACITLCCCLLLQPVPCEGQIETWLTAFLNQLKTSLQLQLATAMGVEKPLPRPRSKHEEAQVNAPAKPGSSVKKTGELNCHDLNFFLAFLFFFVCLLKFRSP